MSETDDTDDLLLIPPDFFVIDSDSGDSNFVEPYYNIVDSLIKQVSHLRDRIDSIESVSLSNPLDYWFDNSDDMQNSTSRYKYNSTDDLYIPQSTQSTPQKPHTKFKLSSLPNSPNIDKFNLKNVRTNREFKSPVRGNASPRNTKRLSPTVSSPEKDDGQMLSEIDTFLSKVKTIQRIHAVRNLENEFSNGDFARNSNVSSDVNGKERQLLADLQHPQQKHRPESNGGEKPSLKNEEIITKEQAWRQGDNKESVPDYGAGVRDALYRNYIQNDKSQGDHKKQIKFDQPLNSWTSADPYSDSSSELTQLTAYDKFNKDRGDLLSSPIHTNALNVLNMHKQLLEDEAQKLSMKSKVREPKLRGANTMNDNFGLLSLADIWSAKPHLLNPNPSQLTQKLQEEKLRRQHCEKLIQELQNRNLELQQKLSVALKVDETKNDTIQQFQEVLERIVAKLERLNKEKQELDEERSKLKTAHSKEIEEASQKIAYYEKEASKALHLAHGNQDKLGSLEKRCADLQIELRSIEKKCKDVQDEYTREIEKNKQLTEILSKKEIELSENKSTLNDARAEIANSKRAIEVCQAEFTAIKNECVKLQNDLKNERDQIMKLKQEKTMLLDDIEERKRCEGELKEDRDKLKKQLENNKVELRNFYQGQVEILVQNKLKEFQTQLDQAENAFKEEIKKREMSIAKTAAMHIQQISEKYSLEIKLLEKKHQEEIKLYQIQVMQHKQHADTLQVKLDQVHERRIQVAKQLQKIMESQWAEALRIITNGKSPTFNDEAFSTIDQLNSLKTRSYNNVEEVLAEQQEEQHNIVRKQRNESAFAAVNDDTTSSIGNNFEKKTKEGYGLQEETPVSSRGQGSRQYNESEIQKYVYLLLNRPPGNPTQDAQQRANEKMTLDNANDHASWQYVDEAGINKRESKGNQRERRFPKPPWK